jgi:predicted ATPase
VAGPPTNLPAPLTPFIGRAAALAALTALLRTAEARLLVLTGPGGVGKTRLALQVAHQLRPTFPDGVFFVRLAAVSDADLVLPTVAAVLGVRETGGDRLDDTLAAALSDKRLLLVLDNFEQVVGAGAAVARLLTGAPDVRILVTSRTVLRVYGEREFPVPPLDLPPTDPAEPTPAQVAAGEAVQLFVARVRDRHPDFVLTPENAATVAAFCRRLEGLPLALELAAARTRLFALPALLARLDRRLVVLAGGPADLPARQQTLRNTLAWSYDLLDAAAQVLFARLAVFAGGGTLDAIEVVTGWDPDPLLAGLESLIAQSLLRRHEAPDGEVRFSMLATIREYALEQLAAGSDEVGTRQAHAEFFLALAEQAEPQLRGPQQVAWLRRLDQEQDNLRAALTYLTEQTPQPDLAGRLANALWRWWPARGQISEGRRWFAAVLTGVDPTPPAAIRPWQLAAFASAGALAGMQCDYAQAQQLTETALAIARRLDNAPGIGRALNNLGIIARRQGRYAQATAYLAEALQRATAQQDEQGIASTSGNLAFVRHLRGEYVEAATLLEEVVTRQRTIDDSRGLAISLENLARMMAVRWASMAASRPVAR